MPKREQMITLCRANQRHHEQVGDHGIWQTFHSPHQVDALAEGFETLESFNEHRLPPGGSVEYPHRDSDIVIYLREGALTHRDSLGRAGVIQTGEFQRFIARRGIQHSERNASETDWAHCFQIWLRPSDAGIESGYEKKRFSMALRRGVLCVVASPNGQNGSLRIYQDAIVHSALLNPGKHVIYELTVGRSAWVHVVEGEVTLQNSVLTSGDGVGITGERVVSLTARVESEILLLDLGKRTPNASKNGRT